MYSYTFNFNMSFINSYETFCRTAPDTFLEKASFFINAEYPQNGLTEKLTRDIWSTFINNKQTIYNFCNKMYLWNQFNECIKVRSKL